jgi:hypothetical protein
MFRKSLCQKAGYFDEQLRSGADFDFSIRLAMHGKAEMAKTPLGFYLNEGLGASTRPNSLQPVERTVVELRYGIYDKIDYSYLPPALKYDISHAWYCNRKWPLSEICPEYDVWMESRREKWFAEGITKYCREYKSRDGLLNRSEAIARNFFHKIKNRVTRH